MSSKKNDGNKAMNDLISKLEDLKQKASSECRTSTRLQNKSRKDAKDINTTPKRQTSKGDSSNKTKKYASSKLLSAVERRFSPKQKKNLPKLDVWLSKEKTSFYKANSSTASSSTKKAEKTVSNTIKSVKNDIKQKRKLKKTEDDEQETKTKKKKSVFSRNDSFDSVSDLPVLKKRITKSRKKSKDPSFERYGITLPTLEDIVKDQAEFEEYKKKVAAFEALQDESIDLSFKFNDLNENTALPNEDKVLDCKHLSQNDLTEAFNKNKNYLLNIKNGVEYSERHERFKNYNVKYNLTTKDLTYNTSTILFTFEQQEHLLSLLSAEFDPEDKLTQYFFQVLLPELCQKIFMDVYNMTYDEAVQYLDSRPVTE